MSFGRLPSRLLLKPGGIVYSASRFSAAGASFVLAAAMTRVLPASQLGQFAAAFAIASFAGIYFASSVRRLVMYRSESADLSDLKVAAALGSIFGVAVSGLACLWMFDPITAVLGALLAGLRGADGYAEIGQAVWCQRGDFSIAARALTVRITASTLVAVVTLFVTQDPATALCAALVLRLVFATTETHVARRQVFARPPLGRVRRSFYAGSWISVASASVLLVEVLPTLGVAKVAGFDDAALLTPLGRIRFGVLLIATTLAELHYPEMATQAARPEAILRISMRGALQFGIAAILVAPLIVLGSPLIFGSKLDGQYDLIGLAILSGATMGLSSIFSVGLTAQARIVPQVLAYAFAAAIATIGTWLSGWSLTGLFVSQSIACAAVFAIFLLLEQRLAKSSVFRTTPGPTEAEIAPRETI